MHTDQLPRRIMAILGTLGLYLTLSAPAVSTAETGGYDETVYYGERCFYWTEAEGNCPAAANAYNNLTAAQDDADCPIIEVLEGATWASDECCYDVVMEACYDSSASGCLDKL